MVRNGFRNHPQYGFLTVSPAHASAEVLAWGRAGVLPDLIWALELHG